MRLLVLHTWLKGNLGDVLQASVLLRSLRELAPKTLDLGGYPAKPSPAVGELLALADRHVPEHFAWYWRYVPDAVRAPTLERDWRRRRAKLFSRYDAIVSAPGPFLADYDARWPSALCDLDVARDLQMPFVLSSHSIGPLPRQALERVRRASLCVAREARTHAYLAQAGVESVLSADYAFLYPFAERAKSAPARSFGTAYRLLFLRSNNLAPEDVTWSGRTLLCGERRFELGLNEKVVLASSDGNRDRAFLTTLGQKLGAEVVIPESVAELSALVAGSAGVVSDRYHPAICAIAFGKPAEILVNREPHKMHGLMGLVEGHDFAGLQALSRTGLAAVRAALTRAPNGSVST